MSDPRLEAALEAALTRGEQLALAEVLDGPRAGSRMLIWPGGQALGTLGSPRLNQRVALYAEGLIVRGGTENKLFDGADGGRRVLTTVHGSRGPSS